MSFAADGFEVREEVLARSNVQALGCALPALGPRGGARNLLGVPEIAQLANGGAIAALAEELLGEGAHPVRAILFDKTEQANWKVGWHQDLAVALSERREVEGFGPWSVKEGVVHAHAPEWLLEQMLALRIHVDDCDGENRPLRVLAGTHRFGKLSAAEIESTRRGAAPTECLVRAGGVVAMRPLLLHASSAAVSPRQRRVIHLEYANAALPAGLAWAHSRACVT